MGTLIDLDVHRRRRATARIEQAGRTAPHHPALRWTVGDDQGIGHRRDAHGEAACGVDGALTVAAAGTPSCPNCYPRAPRVARDGLTPCG